jgi:hypothetical protein
MGFVRAIAIVDFIVVGWGAIAVVDFFVVAWREGEASGREFSVFPGGLLPDASPLRCGGIYGAGGFTMCVVSKMAVIARTIASIV